MASGFIEPVKKFYVVSAFRWTWVPRVYVASGFSRIGTIRWLKSGLNPARRPDGFHVIQEPIRLKADATYVSGNPYVL